MVLKIKTLHLIREMVNPASISKIPPKKVTDLATTSGLSIIPRQVIYTNTEMRTREYKSPHRYVQLAEPKDDDSELLKMYMRGPKPRSINLLVKRPDGTRLPYTMGETTEMKFLMFSHCDNTGIFMLKLRLSYNGKELKKEDTPLSLLMFDGDVIDECELVKNTASKD